MDERGCVSLVSSPKFKVAIFSLLVLVLEIAILSLVIYREASSTHLNSVEILWTNDSLKDRNCTHEYKLGKDFTFLLCKVNNISDIIIDIRSWAKGRESELFNSLRLNTRHL